MTQGTAPEPAAERSRLVNGDDSLYEVVDGQRVEKPFMSAYAAELAFQLAWHLKNLCVAHNLGRVLIEAIFLLPLARGSQQRRPDVAFVSYERWAKDRRLPHSDPWPIVPNLAIEVISQSNVAEEMLDKIEEYFAAGVQLV